MTHHIGPKPCALRDCGHSAFSIYQAIREAWAAGADPEGHSTLATVARKVGPVDTLAAAKGRRLRNLFSYEKFPDMNWLLIHGNPRPGHYPDNEHRWHQFIEKVTTLNRAAFTSGDDRVRAVAKEYDDLLLAELERMGITVSTFDTSDCAYVTTVYVAGQPVCWL